MSRNIPVNRTWRVTFIERANPLNIESFSVIAPTRLLAQWQGREQHHGCIIIHPLYHETVSLIRKPNMCRGGSR